MTPRYYRGIITSLKYDEVFVFASNEKGFHGAGSAGYATFGEFGNVWRDHNYGDKPNGWKGMWTEKGKTGFQNGTKGSSYGLVTITETETPFSLNHLMNAVRAFYVTANALPELTFYVAQAAKAGKHGRSPAEMAMIYKAAGRTPKNVVFQEKFYNLLQQAISK